MILIINIIINLLFKPMECQSFWPTLWAMQNIDCMIMFVPQNLLLKMSSLPTRLKPYLNLVPCSSRLYFPKDSCHGYLHHHFHKAMNQHIRNHSHNLHLPIHMDVPLYNNHHLVPYIAILQKSLLKSTLHIPKIPY